VASSGAGTTGHFWSRAAILLCIALIPLCAHGPPVYPIRDDYSHHVSLLDHWFIDSFSIVLLVRPLQAQSINTFTYPVFLVQGTWLKPKKAQ
jgi:hypothetical protein